MSTLVMIVLTASCGDGDDSASTSVEALPSTTVESIVAASTTNAPTVAPTAGPAESIGEGSNAVGGLSDSSQRLTLHAAGTTASPLGYSEYLPPDYAADAASPLLVFLHGLGGSGDGSVAELTNLEETGIPLDIAADAWPDDRPFVVLAPQHEVADDIQSVYADCSPEDGSCFMMRQHELRHPITGSVCVTPDEIDTFLTYAVSAYDVDPERIYLTGLSCGAFGVWEYIAAHGNEVVAAVVPIAGEGRPAWGTAQCMLGAVPIWAFHGMLDHLVAPAGSIEPLTALRNCTSPPPAQALLTTYDDADHDSWTRTYAVDATDDIYTWMLSFTNP